MLHYKCLEVLIILEILRDSRDLTHLNAHLVTNPRVPSASCEKILTDQRIVLEAFPLKRLREFVRDKNPRI